MKLKKRVNFDICTYCNHQCTFCSNSDDRTVKNQISLEEFKKVMSNVSKYVEMDELGLSAKGEVLINKEFTDIVKSCKKDFNIKYVYISSNGALMDDKKAVEVIEAGLDSIKFSINAIDRVSYEEVHKVDDFDKVVENFKNLLRLKRSKYPNLKLFLSSVIDMDKSTLENKFKNIFGDDYNYIDGISLYAITYTSKFENIKKDMKVTKKCPLPFEELYINSNGTLGLCCKDYFDEINFGSLLENDFMDIYNSDEFIKIRQMHKVSVFPDNHLCKNCLLYGN